MKTLKKLLSILMISAILLPTIGVTSAFADADVIARKLTECLDTCYSTTSAWTFQRWGCLIDCNIQFLVDIVFLDANEPVAAT
jgi:hypothetical protein